LRCTSEPTRYPSVETEHGDYSIFELLGGDIFEVGDKVSWNNATAIGHEQIQNHTHQSKAQIYFQNHHVNESQLEHQLGY
jgi:hypothetical protein